jgi:hypothetical protein
VCSTSVKMLMYPLSTSFERTWNRFQRVLADKALCRAERPLVRKGHMMEAN